MCRISIVDDDPHICLAVRAWRQRCGFGVSIVLVIRSVESRRPDNGRRAWRDAMPSQAFQAADIAGRH